jgi:membrane associated rhomboid family serine protease
MFPIGDDDRDRRSTPVVTFVLIAINVLVFLLELNGGDDFIRQWSFVPARFSADPAGNAPTLLTAMFMHGGWMHLFGNMLYLWIFGDNVEDRFGKVGFLIFYLLCGVAASMAQYAVSPAMTTPNLGASGAIAGVLGAYILMFPKARVDVAIGYNVVSLPAIIVLGFWIALQLFSGVGSIATTDASESTGGVAYMAHVGGFAAGLVLTFLFGGRTGRPSLGA